MSHRTETKILAKEPFCFPENVWFRKNSTDARGRITYFNGNFYLTVPKKFVGEYFGSSGKYWVAKNYTHKKGIALDFSEKFVPHSADSFRRRTLLCFERILVSKFFKQRRGEASRFCRKLCVLLYRSISLVNTSLYQKVSGTKRFVHHTGGYHLFPSKTLCHTGPKKFVGELFAVSESFVYRKSLCIRRGYH